MNILSKATDNRFWYIGTTYSELGDRTLCILLRNPLDDLQGTNDRKREKEYRQKRQERERAYQKEANHVSFESGKRAAEKEADKSRQKKKAAAKTTPARKPAAKTSSK